jgi:hypothetical protein
MEKAADGYTVAEQSQAVTVHTRPHLRPLGGVGEMGEMGPVVGGHGCRSGVTISIFGVATLHVLHWVTNSPPCPSYLS